MQTGSSDVEEESGGKVQAAWRDRDVRPPVGKVVNSEGRSLG